MKKRLALLFPTLVVFSALLLAGCSNDDSTSDEASEGDATSSSSTSAVGDAAGEAESGAEAPVKVMVTNDDGIGSEGIDALVQALVARDDVEIVVVAPAENQSGSGGKTTDAVLEANDALTASGYEATAVVGFPADAVLYGIEELEVEPDLVISGINDGQNIGPLVNISGTVGAARQAAQLGVPSLATSQGFGDPPDFETSVEAVMTWLDENLDAVRDGTLGVATVSSLNAPTCPQGEVQGVVEVPVAPDTGADLNAVDCAGTADPVDDVTAFSNGWVSLSALEPSGSITS
ncbi:MAG: survival protein SurE [Actinomycetia bacterium]|nr:survival protein SurE [Actinomycetes bacterium]